jgi:hypothetical protein
MLIFLCYNFVIIVVNSTVLRFNFSGIKLEQLKTIQLSFLSAQVY